MPTNEQGYLINAGERFLRLAFALICVIGSLAIIPIFIRVLGPFWGYLIGLIAWMSLWAEVHPYFLVSVPEASGLLVINMLKQPTPENVFANQRVFPVGLHPSFPWEKRTSYIDVRQQLIPFQEDIPPQDGVLTTFRLSVTYQPLPQWIPVYVAVSKETIEAALKDVATSYLTERMAQEKTAESARQNARVFETGLKAYFETVQAEETYENRFGIDVTLVRIADVGFNPEFQKALNDRAITSTIRESANGLVGGNVTAKDALDSALVIAGKANKEIKTYEGIPVIVDGLLAAAKLFANTNREETK